MPLVKYVIWIVASPSNSLLHVPIQHLRLVVRERGVEHVELVGCVRNFSSTEDGSISVLAQENCSGLTPFLNVTTRVSRTSVMSSLL